MLSAPEEEALPVQIAYLEGRLRQVAEDWTQLGQWLESDQRLLAAVQAHSESVRAALATAGSLDQQVRSALAELVVIGQVQQFLLEQTIQQAADERSQLEDEGMAVLRGITGLHSAPPAE
jgi:ABC-type transporter Mla subunit MlaD